MYEDDPQDHVFDLLGEAVFGEHPLGRPVIGTRATRSPRPAPTRCTPSTTSATRPATSSSPPPARSTTARWCGSSGPRRAATAPGAARPAPPPAPAAGDAAPSTLRFIAKDTEQYHLALGRPGIARDDERRYALRVLDTILGGTSSSRLFQEVRERRGLAYSIFSFHQSYAGTGQVGIYLGTRPGERRGRRCASSATSSSACARTASPPTSSCARRRTPRAASCSRSSRPRRG